jgi:2-methylcitrate dehydratase PrpD
MSDVTAEIARLVSSTVTLPPAAREAGRRGLLDTIGVALAGVGEDAVQILRSVVGSSAMDGPATVLGAVGRTSLLDAALLNATAAHALDFDDTQANVRGHPSATIVPAALAVAEATGASGAELITSYVVGIEVAARIGKGFGPAHARQGFHSTGTLGVFGAAAASARLLGLDAAQVTQALGIAASSAAGLRLNFGFMAKPLHAGNSARAGLLAAQLAQGGFTAAPDVLDHVTEIFSPGDGDPRALLDDGDWQIVTPGIAVKKYPCCNRGHRALDAILTLVDRLDLAPADVERIDVVMPAGEVDSDGRVGPMIYPRPSTGLQAKFSMQYVVAAAVLDRRLGVGAFTDAAVGRADVAELLTRVVPVADAARPATDPDLNFVQVRVVRRDGREDCESVRFSRGDPRGGVPLSTAELATKYLDCAQTVLPEAAARRSLALFDDLEALPDVRILTEQLRPSRIQ